MIIISKIIMNRICIEKHSTKGNSQFIEGISSILKIKYDVTSSKESVIEHLQPLTTTIKQRFVSDFTGNDDVYRDIFTYHWHYTDYLSSNHTGSGMADEADGGFKLVGNSSGGSAQNTLIAFNDKRHAGNKINR